MRICLLACLIVSTILCFAARNEESKEQRLQKQYTALVVAIIAMGIIMRIGHMLYTPYSLRGHDIGLGANGHADYILTLMQGNLPDSNSYQYYI